MKLPVISGLKVVRSLGKFGFEIDHQTESHMILRESKPPYRRVTVPNHKSIAPGTLISILKQAGVTREKFLEEI